MGRKAKLDNEARVRLAYLAAGGKRPPELAEEFHIGETTVRRYLKENMADKTVGISALGPMTGIAGTAGTIREGRVPRGRIMDEFGVSGLSRFGGQVREDYLDDWNTLSSMVPIIKRMLDYPTISSVLFAIEMTIRAAEWSVEPASEDVDDKEAAEFLEGCMHDMASSWDDHIGQAISMVPYGFAPFEIVYKRRRGPDKDPDSNFDDGLIGWRKLAYRSPDTLVPGNEWVFDENGGIQGLNQQAPPDYNPVSIPIEKMILYRTSSVKNNPQGRSALRSSYIPWYYAKNLAEIEGITAERMGAGVPVIYLGDGTSKVGDGSDFAMSKKVVRDLVVDEQEGIVFPHPYQTTEGRGIRFELVSPPSRGPVAFDTTIERYNQQIAQTLLAQFIFLGLTERGTQALAVRSTDFFVEALTGWLRSITQTLNRYAVPRLFRLNSSAFQGITAFPEISVGGVGKFDVAALVEAVAAAVGAGAITPDAGIERVLRDTLRLPEKTEEAIVPAEGKPAPEAKAEQEPDLGGEDEEEAEGEEPEEATGVLLTETLAAMRQAIEALDDKDA